MVYFIFTLGIIVANIIEVFRNHNYVLRKKNEAGKFGVFTHMEATVLA